MNKKVVTFGEILLRWSKPRRLRLAQGSDFQGNYGGSEANVATSLAVLGDDVEYVTRVPAGLVGDACLQSLRRYGIGLGHVLRGGDRLGTYYFEDSAGIRRSQVVYDRTDSSFFSMRPGMIDWDDVFSDAAVFHCSGITCAVSQSAADATFEAVEKAREAGLTVTCDINYRKNLWRYGARAHDVLHDLMQYSDFIFGDQDEWEVASGMAHIPFKVRDAYGHIHREAYRGYFDGLHRQFPRCRRMLMALRNQMTSTHHTFTGVLWDEGRLVFTRIYDVEPIIDPMGVGDAFVAAFIHASLQRPDDAQWCLDYALAASTLKNTIPGDANLVSEDEILALMQGDASGRISR